MKYSLGRGGGAQKKKKKKIHYGGAGTSSSQPTTTTSHEASGISLNCLLPVPSAVCLLMVSPE